MEFEVGLWEIKSQREYVVVHLSRVNCDVRLTRTGSQAGEFGSLFGPLEGAPECPRKLFKVTIEEVE